MGHHPKANMLAVRGGARRAHPRRKDGVDGTAIYLYGEGWNFGEVAEQRPLRPGHASVNMAGTGIGTFNDRLRDAVRGGGPFDEDPRIQGFAHRPVHRPQRRRRSTAPPASSRPRLLHDQDLIKVGLAGNLRDYRFVDRTGRRSTGARGRLQRPAGRLRRPSPTRSITYVDAHDNETLFDALALQAARRTRRWPTGCGCRRWRWRPPRSARAPSFWHAGADLLRSKSLDRNSYDSGDWFNRIDWTGQDNDFGRGPAAARRTTRPSGRSCGRCWPTRPSSRRRPTSRAAARPRRRAAARSGLARRCSGSARAR